MTNTQEPYAWARGLARRAVLFTTVIAAVLAVTVGLVVFFLRDTPPANAAVHHIRGSGMDALLEATLAMAPECITVAVDGQTILPIFPSSAVRLEHGALIYDGEPFRSGDPIQLPGGEVSDPPADARIPSGCPSANLWLVSP